VKRATTQQNLGADSVCNTSAEPSGRTNDEWIIPPFAFEIPFTAHDAERAEQIPPSSVQQVIKKYARLIEERQLWHSRVQVVHLQSAVCLTPRASGSASALHMRHLGLRRAECIYTLGKYGDQ